jgi:F-type H+-transporting ATPase subunit delta
MAAVAAMYSRALADVAHNAKLDTDIVVEQVREFERAIKSSHDLHEVLMNPSVTHEDKMRVIEAISKRMQCLPEVRNFISVLVQNQRVNMLEEIVSELQEEMDRRNGVAEAEITSAREISKSQQQALEQALGKVAGREKIRATYKLDPAVLGGVVVRLGTTVYDGSVRGQMEQLKERLTS